VDIICTFSAKAVYIELKLLLNYVAHVCNVLCVLLQGVATLLLYPHFDPLRQIDGSHLVAYRIVFNTLIIVPIDIM